jgi:hypothetical protein
MAGFGVPDNLWPKFGRRQSSIFGVLMPQYRILRETLDDDRKILSGLIDPGL